MDFYDILLARNLSGGGGGEVTPESIVAATGKMTEAQAAQTRENIGAGEPLSPQDIADAAGDWLEDNLATPSTPPIDASLSVANAAADAKAVGDALATKADTDGEYDTLTAGVAKQLESTVGITDNAPYLFRTAGGSADIGDLETDKLVGGTVMWNQVQPTANRNGTLTQTTSGTTTATYKDAKVVPYLLSGCVYLFRFKIKYTGTTPLASVYIVVETSPTKYATFLKPLGYIDRLNQGEAVELWFMSKQSKVGQNLTFGISTNSNFLATDYAEWSDFQLYNLSTLFGTAIADALWSMSPKSLALETLLKAGFLTKSYYAYSSKTLLSVKATSHNMVGFNAYDDSTGEAKVVGENVYQITGAYTALSLDGETITPDADGYFTPSNSGILTVTGGNATTTCVHLKWDGEKDGEWEPYVKHSYPLDPDLELRGIPMLDANNGLYYDGDTYENDGTVTRKFGIRAYQEGDVTDGVDMVTDGTNTVYRLTTPTTEQAASFQNPQEVDDFGTEEYVDTRTVPLPVGHVTFYQANLRAKLEMAPCSPDGDGDYIVRQTDGENEYVPLVVPPCMVVAAQNFMISPDVSVAAGATYNTYSLDLAVETQSGYTAAFAYITSCNGSDFAVVKAEITNGVLDATVCNISANVATLTEINAQIIYTRST